MYGLVLRRLSKHKEVLDALLVREPTETRYPFSKLKALPGRASLKEIRLWEKHLTWLEGLLDTDSVYLSNTKSRAVCLRKRSIGNGDMLDIQISGRKHASGLSGSSHASPVRDRLAKCISSVCLLQ